MSQWVDLLRLITDGWQVDAEHTNIPLTELAERTQYLKDILDSLGAGEALYYRSVRVAADVEVGQPVYLDDDDGMFKPALAAIDYDVGGNYGPVAKSSYVWGVVESKENAETADILVAGILRNVDMSSVLATPDVSGAYYLSTAQPGRLTQQKPPIGVYVLYWWADQQVALVTPTPREILEDHIHYNFELKALPAGIPNCAHYGEKHFVAVPDPDVEGWLPADHPVFSGVAPAGAKFGYNLAKNPSLSAIFPPVPIDSYYLEVIRGDEGTGRDPVSFVKVDNNGIWWMSDCYGEAPWPVWLHACSSSSLSQDEDCPPPDLEFLPGHGYDRYEYPMSIQFWFSRMVYKTDEAVVTRLVPGANQPVKLYREGTNQEASSGPLELHVAVEYAAEDTDEAGYKAVKKIDGNRLLLGPVVEKIKSNSPFIVISGTGSEYKQGTIIIDFVDPSVSTRELPVELVALDNVRQDDYSGVLYYSFLPTRDASLRFKLEVPVSGFPTNAKLQLGLRILAGEAGHMADLPLTYRVLKKAANFVDLPLVDSDGGVLELSALGAVPAGKYIDVVTPAFDVTNGATVFVTLSRAANDGYPGYIGIIRQRGIITPV